MSTATKPAIIVIPGSFCPLRFYDDIVFELEAHGYPVHGIELETTGRRAEAPGLYEDAAKVAALASGLADEGNNIVLVSHSYGGLVACEAAKGLAKSVRENAGKKGGIARMVFITAVVGREGQNLVELMADVTVGEYVRVEDGYTIIDPVVAAPKLTYTAYKDIPVSYLLCEEGKGVTPELQKKFIADIESDGGKVDRHPVKADHMINASQPKTAAAVIMKALGDEV
ncbi:Alpha/Beta hydrolase protein [Mycena galopus ATCC 62051]|nr:Alpha/Beta hydrolase protein [Mycena galopus ATCC 62051]